MKPTVLVIREFDDFSKLLIANGFEVINLPLIQTLPIDNFAGLDKKLDEIENYDGLFFTSPKAAEIFLERFWAKKLKFSGKIYVLGNRTKSLLEKSDFEAVFRQNANTAEDLIKSFDEKEFSAQKYLYFCGNKSLRTIPKLLENVAEIDELIIYQTVEAQIENKLCYQINQYFQTQLINCVCFFSPSGVENFVNNFGKDVLNSAKIAVIGDTTAKKIVDENLKISFISSQTKAESFALELIEYLSKNN